MVDDEIRQYRSASDSDAQTYSEANWQAAEAPSVASAEGTPNPDSLRDYILMALNENPEIKAAEKMARSLAARVPQATALPDPMVGAKYLPEPIRTAEGDNPFILAIQQKFLVPGKLDRAGRVALRETRMALEEVQARRLRIISSVKQAYYQIYIIDQTIEVDQTNQELLRGLIDVARSQTVVGQRGQEDVLRAQVELSILESRIIELEQDRKTVASRLNQLMDRRPNVHIPRVTPMELRQINPTVEQLLTIAKESNPELGRLQQQILRDQEALELARLQWWPDVTLGLEWIYMEAREAFQPPRGQRSGRPGTVNRMSEAGSDNWGITLGINVPIWAQRIQGGIEEARQRMLASQEQFLAKQNQVFYEIEDALARVQTQQELAILFRDTIIPQAQQAFEISRVAYTSGTTDFLFVIDNWQKWLTFTIQYHRALGELERSIADLEQAVGLSLGQMEIQE